MNYIKQIFHKSIFLVLLFTAVSTLISLVVSVFATSQKEINELSDFLSNYALNIQITQLEMEKDIVPYTVKDMEKELININHSLIFYKDNYTSNGKEVYFNDKKFFNPNIIKGRTFNENDFLNHTNTIIIEESLQKNIFKKNKKEYFIHEKKEYEVIGVYKNTDKGINANSKYYINYFANNNIKNSVVGQHFFDAREYTNDCVIIFEKLIKNHNNIEDVNVQKIKRQSKDNIKIIMLENFNLIVCSSLTIFLTILNTYYSTDVWLESKKREIGVRLMVGATNKKIFFLILRNYLIIILFSFFVGTFVISKIIISMNIIPLFKGQENFIYNIVGFSICLLIGIITGIINLFNCLKNNIVKIM